MNKPSHPALPDLHDAAVKGRLSRRTFLRYAALLGAGTAAAGSLPAAFRLRPAAAASYGGTLTVSGRLEPVTHPAALSWIAPVQPLRQVAEYLTYTDADNITHPFLLDAWEVNEALDVWTLNIRPNIFFNNGDELVAEDVIFSMHQWLDPGVSSPLKATIGRYLSPGGIEKTGRHQVTLHLRRPEIALPEHLYHYTALVLNHRTFEGDFMAAPHGTGPFTIESFDAHTQCRLKKRPGYWRPGLPFLDTIVFYDLWQEPSTRLESLKNAKIDVIDTSDIDELSVFRQLKGRREIRLNRVTGANVNVLRMRVDRAPWHDNRVRLAMKHCQHREKLLLLAYAGEGLAGHDCHVCPRHPAFCQKPLPRFDPRSARTLLADAGFPDGLDVDLCISDGADDIRRYAELLQSDAARAGFRIRIVTVPEERYRQSMWREVDFGITPWSHQPLETMVLNLAYGADAKGAPTAWNETRWVDPEFCRLLDLAGRTLNTAKRRSILCQLEEIQIQRGSIGIAWWKNSWTVSRRKIRGIPPSAFGYLDLHAAWKED